MENKEYQIEKNKILNRNYSVRRFRLGEISHIGEDVYTINNCDIVMDSYVQMQLDGLIGLSATQKKTILKNGSPRELISMRNFLLSKSMDKSVLLFADDNGRIVRCQKATEEFIPPITLFEAVEHFCDRNKYKIDDITSISNNPYEISIHLKNKDPEIMKFKGEELNMSNLIFTWDFNKLTLDEEYVRLVCANGAMSLERTPIWTYKNKLSDCLNISTELLNSRKNRYIKKCIEAMDSQASIQEVYAATNLLRKHINNKDKAYELTGFSEIKDRLLYSSSKLLGGCRSQNGGFDFGHEEIFRKIITPTRVWDLYNLLTYISSHEINTHKILSERELSRDASAFLSRRRDFVDYIDLDDVA